MRKSFWMDGSDNYSPGHDCVGVVMNAYVSL